VVERPVDEREKRKRFEKEKHMTQETKQGQTPARVEQPAPAGKAEQPQDATLSEVTTVELTDTDLQAVNGGGGVSGGVLGEQR
jgi:hypothetical protein